MITKKQPRIENGVVVGNTYNKYGSKNPIVQWMVGNFIDSFDKLLNQIQPQSVLEIGCGEGHLTERLITQTKASIHALDISDYVLNQAIERTSKYDISGRVAFENKNIFEIQSDRTQSDLVVCCEVLEHLENPVKALDIIADATSSHAIMSVPNEPLWRLLNVARFRYLADLGNTPGHLQHWSKTAFVEIISNRFEVIEILSPLPWTFLLGRVREPNTAV